MTKTIEQYKELADNFGIETFDEYQKLTNLTALYPQEEAVDYVTLGLAGEAGEICNKVKKIIRDDNGILTDKRKNDLVDELSDVMWYVAQNSKVLNLDMSNICSFDTFKEYDKWDSAKYKAEDGSRVKQLIMYSKSLYNLCTLGFKKDVGTSYLGEILIVCMCIMDILDSNMTYVCNKNISKLLDRLQRNVIQGSGDNR